MSLTTNLDLVFILKSENNNYEVLYEAVETRLGENLPEEDRVTLKELNQPQNLLKLNHILLNLPDQTPILTNLTTKSIFHSQQ